MIPPPAKSCLSINPAPACSWAHQPTAGLALPGAVSVPCGTGQDRSGSAPLEFSGPLNAEERGQGQLASSTGTCLLPLHSKPAFPGLGDSNIQLLIQAQLHDPAQCTGNSSGLTWSLLFTPHTALILGELNASQLCR